MDYSVIGGEVKIAARLESMCDPDGIMVSPETYALVKDYVDAEPCEPISVKGVHRKISPYRLVGFETDGNEADRYLRAETEGMRLFLDLGKLDERNRPEAIQELEHILERLRRERR